MTRWSASVSFISLSVCLFPSVGHADSMPSGTASYSTVEEIIVTAQKREERLNDVPLSITALTGDELKSRNIATTKDLVRVVPGLNYQTAVTGAPIFYIRGVGFLDNSPSGTPAVTVYTDEVPLPMSDMGRGAALDLARVEVLKGPQGTLFGGNSTGGAINYIAAKPTEAVEAGASIGFGRFSAAEVQGYLSGPVTDKVFFRIAGEYRMQGDWQYSATRPGDTRGQKDFLNGRISLAAEPSDSLKLLLTVSGWRDRSDSQTPQLTLVSPAIPFPPVTNALNTVAYVPTNARVTDWLPGTEKRRDDSFYQASLRGDLDISDHVRLTSITAYSNLSLHDPYTLSGANFPTFNVMVAKGEVISQELRLAGDTASLHWMVGGNFQHTDAPVSINAGPFVSTTARGLYDTFKMPNNAQVNDYAVFGSLEQKLSETVTARGSIRYSEERRKHQGCLADAGDGKLAFAFGHVTIPFVLGGPVTNIAPGSCVTLDDTTKQVIPKPAQGSLNENNLSWRIGLDWKAQPNTLIYATVAKGYKAGGYTQVPAVFVSQLKPVTQESVLTYEAGIKSDLFDRKVHVDLAGFYYDYTNKQLQGYVNIVGFGALPTLVNIPKSRVIGGEISLTARPTQGLRVQLAGTILDTKVQTDPSLPRNPLNQPTTFVGEPFPNTPKYQATADIEQTVPLSDNVDAYFGGGVQYHSSASGAFGSDSSVVTRTYATLNSYVLVDLRAGLRIAHPSIKIEIWGNNVTDKYYWNAAYAYSDTFVRYTGQPSTWGVRLSYTY